MTDHGLALDLHGTAPSTATVLAPALALVRGGARAQARPVSRVVRALHVSDGLAVALAAVGAGLVIGTGRARGLPDAALLALLALLVAVPAWLMALRLARAYEPRYLFAGSGEIHRVAIAGAGTALSVVALGWLLLERQEAPVVLGSLGAAMLLTVAGRWVVRMRVQRANRAGMVRTPVLVVGTGDDVAPLVDRLARNRYHGWQVTGDYHLGHAGDGSPEQEMEALVRAAGRADASLVLLTPAAGAHLSSVAELQRALHDTGRDLALAPPLVEAIGPRVSIDSVCGLPIVRVAMPEVNGPRQAIKRIADIAAAGLAVVLLLPLLVGTALAVRLTTRGPAIFRQQRVARDGRLFRIWKFRTMYLDADARQAAVDILNEGAGPLFKMRRDPRVTPVGRWLRRTSLDELPQLVNVLRGDMSLVGPRPALPREVACYDEVTRRRLMVRPGITGLWQIHGRSDLPWEETRRLDVRYVENWSLGFDLSIVMRTVDAVIRGRGAY